MSAYPWGFTTPGQTIFNLPDQGQFATAEDGLRSLAEVSNHRQP